MLPLPFLKFLLEFALSLFAGGMNLSGSLLKSTILVTINGHLSGPELPYSNANFCFLKNPQDSSFIMVGGVYDSKSLQIYDFKSNVWTALSTMPAPVIDTACALNYYEGDLSIIIIGGDRVGINPGMDLRVQIYSFSSRRWKQSMKFEFCQLENTCNIFLLFSSFL